MLDSGGDSPSASSMDTKRDTEDNRMEGMTMEREIKHTMGDDFSDDMHQLPSLGEGASNCTRVGERSRPSLLWTKSFPPYSQCIGGLGDRDSELDSETSIHHQQHLNHDEMMKDEDWMEGFQSTERKDDVEVNPRCAREEMREKWKAKVKERSGGSYEDDRDRWDRGRSGGKRRVEENGGERVCDDEERVGGTKRYWTHRKGRNSTFEKEKRDEERKRLSVLVEDGENKGSGEDLKEEAEELPGTREGSTSHQWSSPHPILSKLLNSSSTTSSCSINLSSVESDDVFSEGEDDSKKKTSRKCHSWKTYLTMMHWSLRRQSSWAQLAGHQGNFQLSSEGEVLKLHNEEEAKCLERLMRDPLRPFVPEFHGTVTRGERCYIRLEDLLSGLRKPVIMDCKMGVRTYQEEELTKAKTKDLRSDMYQRMVKIDPSTLSEEEHRQRGVTKWRYLQWRDTTSSTSTLGFRIEGIMMEDGSVQRDFRQIKTLAQVTEALLYFTRKQLDVLKAYHSRLLALSDALRNSRFFRTHEVIGSSLLFVHDPSSMASVWMIDFGKTTPVQDTIKLRHNIPWVEGSREDGYLIGLTSLITSLSQAISAASFHKEEGGREEESITMKQTEECG
ncbi:inositol-trisphosphate 3-kinase A [Pleuronectes platessa]|uniref:inositol-trisphosphate 3-kinase A n=1 Tax=Pleuronectes platessa TaxID=8262 RepID=UPI00232A6997|nr:inositol-trisphosphate 3-kinase A [Pleuronectes platessa]